MEALHKHHISVPVPATTSRVLDKLISHFIEPLCVNPTFVTDHPKALSPLAKARDDRVSISVSLSAK